MEYTPIEYGKLACDALMHKFNPEDLPPAKTLFYHQGVFLSGMQRIYLETREKKYFNYIKKYIDSVIGEKGELMGFCHEIIKEDTPDLAKYALTMLDHKQPSILLYNLLEETKEEKYAKAIRTIGESMYYWPINKCGGYWHMMTQPNQMWLDGAYMAGPLSMMYSDFTGDDTLANRAIKQVFIMDDKMKDKNTGLYYHGWDESKESKWADKETGLSKNIWCRALGWYSVAVLDIIEFLDKSHPSYKRLKQISSDLLTNLKKYQDQKSGMWFEIVDKIDYSDNWIESSGTNLFIYSYAKAIRLGLLSKNDFEDVLKKAYKGMVESLYFDDEGHIVVDNVCIGTNIEDGSYEHYINREKIKNDLHGVGAFVLMCTEYQKYINM